MQGTHSSACICKPGVGFWVSSGNPLTPQTRSPPGDSKNTESSGWIWEHRNSVWYRQHGVPWDSGTRSSVWLGVPGVPVYSGNPELRVSPGNRSIGFLRETGRSQDFRVTPGTTGPVQFDSGYQEFRVTLRTQSGGLFRERGVPINSAKQESSEWIRELWLPGDFGNPVFRLT